MVEESSAGSRFDARVELGRHDPDEMDDLERVLEDVLAVARPEAESAENLDELLVERAAVRLEDGLLARMDDVLLDLRFRLVIHLLDSSRMDAAVLDQLGKGQLGDLAADPLEGGENDRPRRVIDDEVDARQVRDGSDGPFLAAAAPTLPVVGGATAHPNSS